MTPANACIWTHAYRYEPCGMDGFPFCPKHATEKCSNKDCANQAIGECSHSGQFVCGYPYCAECGEHFHDAKKAAAHMAARRRKRLMTFATQEPELFTYMDGGAWCAVRGDFINVQESKCGFGPTKGDAVAALYADEARQ